MNYYEARELLGDDRKGTGLYHFTMRNGDMIYAVGNCSPWTTCPKCGGKSAHDTTIKCVDCGETGLVKKNDPCPGHATKAEACDHYRAYMLDHIHFGTVRGLYECDVCKKYTNRTARVAHRNFTLCEEHLNRESIEALMPAGAEFQITSSD